jgi:tetraacyldisaccharide 4'-kinase
VISVGSLLAGGAGKTPFVVHLAGRLSTYRAAVLSRGYGGREPEYGRVGADADPRLAGDEPVLLARRAGIPVWVGHDRAAVAQRLSSAYEVFILDDGFQHLRLKRALDICLVPDLPLDAVLPAGLWRESPGALADADFVVCTPRAPVWLSRHYAGPVGLVDFVPGAWQSAGGAGPPPARALAFSGIARPERFLGSLDGFELVGSETFPDHHAYSPADLKALWRKADKLGAGALLTTAKDAVRVPSSVAAESGIPLYWRDVDLVWIGGEEDFASILRAALGSS